MTVHWNKRLALALQTLLSGKIAPRERRGIPAITLEEIAEVKQFFPLEKFFIFGHARSGTTLLVRLVRLHPQVHCNYQAHFFTRPPTLQSLVATTEIEEWLSRRSNRWNHGRDLSPLVLRVAADFILEREARALGKSIVGDKSPNSLLHGESVRLMSKVYPEARLIYIVRDGRDASLSHRFQSFIDASQHLSAEDRRIREQFARDPELFLRGERSLFTEKGIQKAAKNWVRNVTETEALGKELYGERYLSLRFEDLLSQAWEQMSRLWQFLGAETALPTLKEALDEELRRNPDADWQRVKAADLVQAVEKGKQGSWRDLFTPRDRQVFKEVAGKTLIAWGYEQDLNW